MKTPREFADYAIAEQRVAWRLWRPGQAVFNLMRTAFPAEVERLRGTDVDPFHHDGRIDAFVAAVEQILPPPQLPSQAAWGEGRVVTAATLLPDDAQLAALVECMRTSAQETLEALRRRGFVIARVATEGER